MIPQGHASILFYAMLHPAQVKAVNSAYEPVGRALVTLEDIKSFRELGSRCPGHPSTAGPPGWKR